MIWSRFRVWNLTKRAEAHEWLARGATAIARSATEGARTLRNIAQSIQWEIDRDRRS